MGGIKRADQALQEGMVIRPADTAPKGKCDRFGRCVIVQTVFSQQLQDKSRPDGALCAQNKEVMNLHAVS